MGNTSLHENNRLNNRPPPSNQVNFNSYNSTYYSRLPNPPNQYQSYQPIPNRSSFQVNGGPDAYIDYSDPLTHFRAGALNGSSFRNDVRGRESSG